MSRKLTTVLLESHFPVVRPPVSKGMVYDITGAPEDGQVGPQVAAARVGRRTPIGLGKHKALFNN